MTCKDEDYSVTPAGEELLGKMWIAVERSEAKILPVNTPWLNTKNIDATDVSGFIYSKRSHQKDPDFLMMVTAGSMFICLDGSFNVDVDQKDIFQFMKTKK